MFTGLIEALGEVVSAEPVGGDMRLRIRSESLDMSDVALGDSIATNGCCLTAVELFDNGYLADVSVETLSMTTLGRWQPGTRVNLEKSLLPTTRMGGHMVSGHVDGVAEIISRESSARSDLFWVRVPEKLARYVAHKGSIAIDGTSLTVNQVRGSELCLTIVPHTLEHTIIGGYQAGTLVNVEVDLIARYLERLQLGEHAGNAAYLDGAE